MVFLICKNCPRNVADKLSNDLQAAGVAPESFTSGLLQELETKTEREREETETLVRDCATVAYGGASDTVSRFVVDLLGPKIYLHFPKTVSAECSFLLAMLLYPGVQEQAQKEIYSVVEHDRLPDFNDRSKLPYVSAVMKETLRWHSPAPQGGTFCVLTILDAFFSSYSPSI